MPALRTQKAQFHFCASAIIRPNVSTHIDLRMPSAPWRARGVQPTITNIFKCGEVTSRRTARVPDRDYDSEADSADDKDDDVVSSRASTPGSDGRGLTPANTSTVEQGRADRFINLAQTNASRKGKGRQDLVRYPSLTTVASAEAGPSRRGSSAAPASSRAPSGVSVAGGGSNAEIWTRYGVQNGEPVFIRQHWKSSTKDKNCLTFWWECYSRVPLSEPPVLSGQPDLALGDIFSNVVMGLDTPKLWIWATVDGKPVWKPISEGETREDGRRLTITPTQKRPSWVKSDWCVKRMLKQHRAQSVPRG